MPNERRQATRISRPPLTVRMRERNRFRWTPVECIDFNRHGMAIAATRPLPEGTRLSIALEALELRIEAIHAVVHNCRQIHGSWRCGLQFRPDPPETRDGIATARLLSDLEKRLEDSVSRQRRSAAGRPDPAPHAPT